MTVKYAVTFEFLTNPPLTYRGTVAASRTHTCVARATKQAQDALKPVNWSSMVCVPLERLDTEPEPAEDEVETTGESEPVEA